MSGSATRTRASPDATGNHAMFVKALEGTTAPEGARGGSFTWEDIVLAIEALDQRRSSLLTLKAEHRQALMQSRAEPSRAHQRASIANSAAPGVAGAEHGLACGSSAQGREAPAWRHWHKALLCGAVPGLRRLQKGNGPRSVAQPRPPLPVPFFLAGVLLMASRAVGENRARKPGPPTRPAAPANQLSPPDTAE
jgi:hypothetical protein